MSMNDNTISEDEFDFRIFQATEINLKKLQGEEGGDS